MPVHRSVLELIGSTPIVSLSRLNPHDEIRILAKLEFFNPGGSVKDRIALSMIEEAERKGLINRDTVIIEPTSGNTGIGLALVCAVKGYKLIITMPESMSPERRKILRLLGAEVVLTPADYGMKGAVEKAEELKSKHRNAFIPNQFGNVSNPDAHFKTTAEEIWRDTGGEIDYFVAGVGTGGTLTGVGKFLKSRNPDVKVVAVEPAMSPVISGGKPGKHKIQGIGAGFIPDVLDRGIIDEVITVEDEEAGKMMVRLAREEGILAGISAGANVSASLKIAEKESAKGKTILTVIPDTAERYLNVEWLSEFLQKAF